MATIAGGIIIALVALTFLALLAETLFPLLGLAILACLAYLLATHFVDTLKFLAALLTLVVVHGLVTDLRLRFWAWYDGRKMRAVARASCASPKGP